MGAPESEQSQSKDATMHDANNNNAAKAAKDDDELSEEDRALKEKLELLVTRAMDRDAGVQKLALETIRNEIRSATSSMTSVPKPLKFLRNHFVPLKKHYAQMNHSDNKVFLADVLSVLAMTMGDELQCESLRYKIRGSSEPPHQWGHEYVRHLAGEISREYNDIHTDPMEDISDAKPKPASTKVADDGTAVLTRATDAELMNLVEDIVPFLISSNAEPEAVDLLIEVCALEKLLALADRHNYSRVCLYLKSCAEYAINMKEADSLLKVAADIYIKVEKLPDAMQVAIRRADMDQIIHIYSLTEQKPAIRVQLAFDLGRANILLDESVESDFGLREAMSNRKLSEQFLHLAGDLEVMEPKSPDDIYKMHLIDSRAGSTTTNVDSARGNLASTFVNAFVNMGFGKDILMSDSEAGWIYRNKEHGMMSAAASLGMIMLWDVDTGLSEIDKYMYVEQEQVKAGSLLAVGIVSAGVRHEVDPAFALLPEHLSSDVASIRNGAILGLGLAYAGTCKEDIKSRVMPIALDQSTTPDSAALAALCLGLVFVGSADEDLSASFLETLTERKSSSAVNSEPMLTILMPLALGLLFLGKQEAAEAVEETVRALVGTDSLLGRLASVTLQACAYCGTGDVEQVQNFLTICGEHPAVSENSDSNGGGNEARSGQDSGTSNKAAAATASSAAGSSTTDRKGSSGGGGSSQSSSSSNEGENVGESERVRIATAEQSVAVLGLGMVAMGEELGAEMCVRTFGHLLQYGDAPIRRMVPLAISLLSVSNPKLNLMDLLSKFTHDSDMEVAQAAILGLGLIGAGTNNSRIAGILRQLSSYYSKEASSLFLVRIAQGLLHSGKGLVTMNPYYGDSKFVENKTAMAGLLTMLFCCLDMKATILGKNHYLLYVLALAARPRMVFTVDETMKFVQTSVRVGTAVDTVGQAGRPKSITGFQTHSTPVLIAGGERAELATGQYLTEAACIEGVVVVSKNPDWEESGLEEAAAAMDTVLKKSEAAGSGSSAVAASNKTS